MAPIATEYLPRPHSVQREASVGLYVPAGQDSQAVEAALLDSPAAQSVQSEATAPVVAELILPPSQNEHCSSGVVG